MKRSTFILIYGLVIGTVTTALLVMIPQAVNGTMNPEQLLLYWSMVILGYCTTGLCFYVRKI